MNEALVVVWTTGVVSEGNQSSGGGEVDEGSGSI